MPTARPTSGLTSAAGTKPRRRGDNEVVSTTPIVTEAALVTAVADGGGDADNRNSDPIPSRCRVESPAVVTAMGSRLGGAAIGLVTGSAALASRRLVPAPGAVLAPVVAPGSGGPGDDRGDVQLGLPDRRPRPAYELCGLESRSSGPRSAGWLCGRPAPMRITGVPAAPIATDAPRRCRR